jgi:hypothetical protein
MVPSLLLAQNIMLPQFSRTVISTTYIKRIVMNKHKYLSDAVTLRPQSLINQVGKIAPKQQLEQNKTKSNLELTS